MLRLKQHDVYGVLEFVRHVYSARSVEEYARHITTGLGRLIGANYISYNEVDLRRGRNFPVVDPPEAVRFPGYTDGIFERHLGEHPIVAHFVRTGDLAAVKISDFASRRQFHRLGIYQEFFRHVRTEYQLAAGVVAEGEHLIDIGINRTRPDFTERDRAVLNIVRGYLAEAHRNAEQRSTVEADLAALLKGTDDIDAAVVILGSGGSVRVASARAQHLLNDYFGGRSTSQGNLPEPLARWLRHAERDLTEDGRARCRPFVIDRNDRRLLVQPLVGSDRMLLLLKEELLDITPRDLEPLDLTHRETEVLAWVAKGKTDAEVAAILDARPRTIGKHLERIYQKLGVENRTAAAARAFATAARRSPVPHEGRAR